MRGGKCCFRLVQHSSGHPEDQSTLRDWESGEGPRESRRTDEEAEDLVYGWTVFEDVKEIRLGRQCCHIGATFLVIRGPTILQHCL